MRPDTDPFDTAAPERCPPRRWRRGSPWLVAGLLGLGLASCGAQSKAENEKYLDYLASLVVAYQDRHEAPPEDFEAAHNESGVVLRNRGDRYGRALIYVKCGDRGFLFRARGKNGRDDLGFGDDVDVYYLDGRKVAREPFVDSLKKIDGGLIWSSYREMFEK